MESIELLCVDDVLEIHKEAIEIFGGSFGYFRDTETKIKSVLDHAVLGDVRLTPDQTFLFQYYKKESCPVNIQSKRKVPLIIHNKSCRN